MLHDPVTQCFQLRVCSADIFAKAAAMLLVDWLMKIDEDLVRESV